MATKDEMRHRNVQKQAEAKLSDITQTLLKGYIKLPNNSGIVEMDKETLTRNIEDYVREIVKDTSLVSYDEKGQAIAPDVVLDTKENVLSINGNTIEVLSFDELTNMKTNVYGAIENEYDYMSHILSMVKYADKIKKAKSRLPGEGQSLVENIKNARALVTQDEQVRNISEQEAYMVMGSQLARAITSKMLSNLGFKRKDSKVLGIHNEDYDKRETFEQDLKTQSIQTSNRVYDTMEEEGLTNKANDMSVDEIIKNNSKLLNVYPSLKYEYDSHGNQRSYAQVKEIVSKIKMNNGIYDPEVGSSFDEVVYNIGIRIVERKYRDEINKGSTKEEAYEVIAQEIGDEDFKNLSDYVQKEIEGGNTIEDMVSTAPQINSSEIEDAVRRVSPTVNKKGEKKDFIPSDVYDEYKEKANNLLADKNEEKEEVSKVDTTLEDIFKAVEEIKENQRKEKEDPSIRVDPKVIYVDNDDNSNRTSNRTINKNIDRSKHIDKSDHSVHYYYTKDKDEEKNKKDKEPKVVEPEETATKQYTAVKDPEENPKSINTKTKRDKKEKEPKVVEPEEPASKQYTVVKDPEENPKSTNTKTERDKKEKEPKVVEPEEPATKQYTAVKDPEENPKSTNTKTERDDKGKEPKVVEPEEPATKQYTAVKDPEENPKSTNTKTERDDKGKEPKVVEPKETVQDPCTVVKDLDTPKTDEHEKYTDVEEEKENREEYKVAESKETSNVDKGTQEKQPNITINGNVNINNGNISQTQNNTKIEQNTITIQYFDGRPKEIINLDENGEEKENNTTNDTIEVEATMIDGGEYKKLPENGEPIIEGGDTPNILESYKEKLKTGKSLTDAELKEIISSAKKELAKDLSKLEEKIDNNINDPKKAEEAKSKILNDINENLSSIDPSIDPYVSIEKYKKAKLESAVTKQQLNEIDDDIKSKLNAVEKEEKESEEKVLNKNKKEEQDEHDRY